MATEFDNSLHWGLFLTGTTLTSETGKYVRVSELVLSALRAAGVFSNMVDGIVAPATDKLWLDKNVDPAVLKEWDATGASWVPMSYGRLFGRAAVDKLTVTGGTGNAVVVSQPVGFQANRLYLMTPTQNNSAAATITVAGVGSYGVKYGNGADIGATEFSAGRQAVLFFTGVRFEVVFPLSELSATVLAAQASASAAAASASSSSTSASNAATYATNAANSATASANSATAAANAVAALPYNFSTTTTDADPGAGIFRLNNAAPGSATAAYIDNVDSDGVTATGVLDTWDDSTTAVRGVLTIRSKTNAAIRHSYNVTGSVVDGSGYRKLTLAYVGGSGTLANGAAHWLIFERTGDAGEVTLTGTQTLSNKTLTSPIINGTLNAQGAIVAINTSASVGAAPTLELYRDAVITGNTGIIRFPGKNAAGTKVNYGDIVASIMNNGVGVESSVLDFRTYWAGAYAVKFTIGSGFWMNGAAGGDPGTGKINATELQQNGVPVATAIATSQGVAKAWVNFNGTGTVAINDSFNVSSITDNGVGNYTVNFATALANANYAAVGMASGNLRDVNYSGGTKTTTALGIVVGESNVGGVDTAYVGIIVMGD
ncbi:hypothetical protein [Aminobacter sp. MDW-2]|uniref:hypothetical protein n=1 Tax=Aminobacter sp. MDW-2 TaxID=2666139 RepID=UPI0012B01E12|nr:hypothetical protein [Aminobacter sp. MDW-2]MRX34158.1 hypothetical protein [Aminobacter sp. MDW-2]QNH33201.1 hypothetical protein H5P29_22190 [Aminobacter sp. MDW-2]